MPKKKAAKRANKTTKAISLRTVTVTSRRPLKAKGVAKSAKKQPAAASPRSLVKKAKAKVAMKVLKSKKMPTARKVKMAKKAVAVKKARVARKLKKGPPLHRPLAQLGSSKPEAFSAGEQESMMMHAKTADQRLAERGGPADFQKAAHTRARHR